MITSLFSLKLCKKGDSKVLHMCCCIWHNTWWWTYSETWNCKDDFIWPWFLLLVLLGKSNFCQIELWYLEENEVCKCSWSLYYNWKKYCNELGKSQSWQLLFEVPLFRFILFLHFSIYIVIIMNIQWSKQSLYK